MNKKIRILLFPFVLLTMMCICPNFDTENFAKTEPKVSNMSGRYIPTDDTLKYITGEGQYKVSNVYVSLFPDGSFEMQDMPDWWLTDFGEPQGCLISSRGDWEIVKQQSWWELKLKFPSDGNLCLEKFSNGLSTSVPIVVDDLSHDYRLWFYVGDPDSGHVMIFKKVSEK